jgi:hypothetical protein
MTTTTTTKKEYVPLFSHLIASEAFAQPPRKKTKGEVMAEVIAKSKEHKVPPTS